MKLTLDFFDSISLYNQDLRVKADLSLLLNEPENPFQKPDLEKKLIHFEVFIQF